MNRHHIWALAVASCLGLAACGDDTGGGTGGAGAGSSGTMTGDGGSDAASTGSGGLTHGSPAEGIYLFALSARLDNSKPILFQGDVTFGDDPSAPSFTLSLTPLRTPFRTGTDNASIAPLTLLLPPLDLGPFDLAPDGSFDAQFPEVQVTGKANVFSLNDLQAVVEIKGRFSEDPAGSPDKLGFVCGTLEGEVIAPIALDLTPDENFFSMTKVDPAALPNDVAYNCAGDRSDPFHEDEGTGGGGTGGEGGDGAGGSGSGGSGGGGTGGVGGDGSGGAGSGGAPGVGGAGGAG